MMLGLLLATAMGGSGFHAEVRRDPPGLTLVATNRTARNLCFHLRSTDSPFREGDGHPGPGFDAWMRGIDIDDPPSDIQVVWADGAAHEYALTGGVKVLATIVPGGPVTVSRTLDLAVYDCRALLSRPWGKARPAFTSHLEVPE